MEQLRNTLILGKRLKNGRKTAKELKKQPKRNLLRRP